MGKKQAEPAEPMKFILGFILIALGFLVFYFAAVEAKHMGYAASWYVVLAYFLFPVAELCVIPIALSLVTRLAPTEHKGLFVGLFLLACSASSFVTQLISRAGQIGFNIHSHTTRMAAAGIYQHLFVVSIATLLIAAVVLFAIKPFLYRLIKPA